MCIAFHTLVILYTVHTLYILYVYDLFHILLSVSQTYGSIVCVYVCMYVCIYEHAVHRDSN
jgi:hypothetical protein